MQEFQMEPHLIGFLPYDQENEGVGGAIVKEDTCTPSKVGTMAYLNEGDDLKPILGRVEKSGGKIEIPKTQITPEIGYFRKPCSSTF